MYTLPRVLLILVTVGLSLSKKKIGLFASMKKLFKNEKKKCSYFIFKVLFVLKIFKFLC